MQMVNPLISVNGESREMTQDEYHNYLLVVAQSTEQQAEATAKADARTSALNKLSALGLTNEEIDSL